MEISNEEKAKMLVDGLGIIYTDCNRVTIKKLLMKMAEWKDEQLNQEKQQWIDKACKALENILSWAMDKKPLIKFTKERFLNDFRKSIKG